MAGGRSPSRAMASSTRAWLSIMTSSTLVMPATAPSETMTVADVRPWRAKALAMGASMSISA